jgi:trehalose 6-phosphate synthase/phosphatase
MPFERENNSDGRHASNGRRAGQKSAGPKSGNKSSGSSTSKSSNSNSTKSSGVRSKGNVSQSVFNNGSPSRSSNKKEKSFLEDEMVRQEGSSVLDLRGDNYFSCAVGRKRSNARYSLPSSEEVVSFLKKIADSYSTLGL